MDKSSDTNQLAFSDPQLPVIMVVTSTNWEEAPRIRHQVSRQFIRWYNVFYIEFFPFEKKGSGQEKLRKINDRLIIYRPDHFSNLNVRLYANIPFIHHWVNLHYLKDIQKVVQQMNIEFTAMCNFLYFFPEIMDWEDIPVKIYFCFHT